jgi:alpha-tubulin suppressor-like RCC1 family protein
MNRQRVAVVASIVLFGLGCSLRNIDRLLRDAPDGGVLPDSAIVSQADANQPCAEDLCAVDVAAFEVHTCAALRDGRVLCWGGNDNAQVSLSAGDVSKVPVEVDIGASANAVAVGGGFSCARLVSGEARCWGSSHSGMLGAGDPPGTNDKFGPRPVIAESDGKPLRDVTAISASRYHTLAISGGRLVGWGEAEGTGNMGFATAEQEVTKARTIASPTPVEFVAAGYDHGCIISQGSVYGFGASYDGQLAGKPSDGGLTAFEPIPATQLGSRKFTKICAGATDSDKYSCGVDTDGKLVCWGNSPAGATGAADTDPHDVMPGVVDVSCTFATTCAITRSGGVYCFGAGDRGQLGRGTVSAPTLEDARKPMAVPDLENVARISVGAQHACAVTRSGAVRCWGANDLYQLGDGTQTDRGSPVKPTL